MKNENEELYRMLVENAMDALIICDQKANLLYVSPSMEKLSGYKREELVGHNAFEFYHAEDISINERRLQQLLEGKDFASIELRFRKKNGEYAWCDMAAKPVMTNKGKRRIVVVARDVTERNNLQEQLKKYSENLELLATERSAELHETTEYLEQLVNRLPLAIIAWDRKLETKTSNPEATHMYGFSETEFLGMNVANLFLRKDGEAQLNKILFQLDRGEAANFIAENVTKDRKNIICSWTNTPLRKANENIDSVLSIIEDVTDKKRLEERLKEIAYSLSGTKAGESYLVSSIQHCLKIAFDIKSHGVKCLFIVRENPDYLIRDYNFRAEDIVLLSLKPIKEFRAINNLQEVAIEITKFLKDGGGLVLLGGLEYLVSRYGFNPVFMMLQEKRFEFLETGATLLVPVNLETLDTKEKGLLNSELKLINR